MIQAGVSATGRHDLPVEDCRAQLALIVTSADFDATGRERRFLTHVVEETLAGRGDRIKAYTIATEVFGRGESFDAQTDPIVRIEAGHLRRALERYYLTSGQADLILITIPKGGYVPVFSRRSPTPVAELPTTPDASLVVPAPAVRRRRSSLIWVLVALLVALAPIVWWWHLPGAGPDMPERPRVLVQAFEDQAGTTASAAIASGLKQEVISQLSKFKDIVVMESTAKADDTSVASPRFILAGSVNLSTDAFRLQVRFINRRDDSVLWAESYDGGMKVADLLQAEADIARKVTTTLAQTYGVIFQADAFHHVENPPDDWAAYSCTLSFYAYRVDLNPETRSSVRTCLEKSVDRFPNYATAWGLLSLIYIDDYRFDFSADRASSPAALAHAFTAARRAVGLDPLNIRGRQAEMFALYYRKEIDAALSVGKEALAVNPNDTELLGEYGDRLAMSGNWHEGCALIGQARQRNPSSVGYYDIDLAMCSYFLGDYVQAAIWIKKSPIPSNPVYHMLAAAIFGEGGDKVAAERERAWLDQNQPALVKNIRQDLSMRLLRSQDVEFVLGSLRKAGLDVPH
ncbi:TolB amino-terminal domain-containing protein [Mesorhizobium sp. NFR06]|nr:TolB amino-terminal domain-containing protein [Mesorhizobium sp. NFR06]